MSSRKKFFESGLMLTIVALSIRSVSMLFSSFISKTVGSEGVGLFTVIMTVYGFAVTFATSGISLTVTRLVASAKCEREAFSVLRGALIYSLIFGISGAILLFFFSDFIAVRILAESRAALPLSLLSFSLPLIALSSVYNGYFVGVKRVRANAIAQVFGQALRIAFSCSLVLTFGKGDTYLSVVLLSLGIVLTETLVFVLILVEYLIDVRKNPARMKGRSEFLEVSKMALPLALSQYFRSLLLSAEHILIPRRIVDRGESNAEALSSYGTLHGMALPTILFPMSPLSSFSGLLVPEFAQDQAHGNKARMSRITTEALNTTLAYASVCAVFVFYFSEELGYSLYASFDAGYYIRCLAPIIPLMYLDHVTDQILKGIGEHVYSMWVNIADSCLSLLLVYFLIPQMGIMGYALVIIIMEAFNFLMSMVRLVKKIKLRISPSHSLVRPCALAAAACFLSDMLFSFNGEATRPFWLCMKILFGVCVLVFLDRFFRLALRKPIKNISKTKMMKY